MKKGCIQTQKDGYVTQLEILRSLKISPKLLSWELNCVMITVRSLILEIQERIKSCRVRDVVDKETQAISSVKESVVEDPKEA